MQPEVFEKRLSSLSVDGVCKLLYKIEDINSAALPEYNKMIKEHNITGKVLLHCDLDELKKVECGIITLINIKLNTLILVVKYVVWGLGDV